MGKRSRAVLALGVLGLSLSGVSAGECMDLTSRSACEKFQDGCSWILMKDGVSRCAPCGSLLSPFQCGLSASCAWSDDTHTCLARMDNLALSLVGAPPGAPGTAIMAGEAVAELASFEFSPANKAAFTSAVKNLLGAQQVWLDTSAPGGGAEVQNCGQAPLCANDPATTSVSSSATSAWGVVPLQAMGGCCAIRDTRVTSSCQVNDPSAPHVRSTGTLEPYCDESAPDSETCLSLRVANQSTTLTVQYGSDDAGAVDVQCCQTCSCYGDPHCVSFKQQSKSWQVCDSRDTRVAGCPSTRSACVSRKDHAGNACLFRPPGWQSFWQSGAECQPNPASGPAWMTMYKTEEASFLLSLAERGVIREFVIVAAEGNYSLSAQRCLARGATQFGSAWAFAPSAAGQMPDLQMVSGWGRVQRAGQFDVTWTVQEARSGVMLSLTCTGTAHATGGATSYGNFRMNVNELVEPNMPLAPAGFCQTGSILAPDAPAAYKNSLAVFQAVDASCAGTSKMSAAEVAKLWCPTATINAYADCWSALITKYAPAPYKAKAMALFKAGNVPGALCAVINAFSAAPGSDFVQCVSDIRDDEQSGYLAAVDKILHSRDGAASGGPPPCWTQAMLNASLDACTVGVLLQYQESPGNVSSWTTVLAIPDSAPLCKDLAFTSDTNLKLFTRPVRFLQQTPALSCLGVNKCAAVAGVNATLLFSPPAANPPKPPTGRPTSTPTAWPTMWPTEWPTEAPTAQPSTAQPSTAQPSTAQPSTAQPSTAQPTTGKPTTGKPTTGKPTGKPTESPTVQQTNPPALPTPGPSAAPSKQPTTMWPSKAPTAQPTTAQPTTKQPTTAQPTTAQPTTAQPTTAQPTTAQPTTAQPTTKKPTTAQPTTAQPTTAQPSSAPSLAPTFAPFQSNPPMTPSAEPTTAAPSAIPTKKPVTRWPTRKPATKQPTTAQPLLQRRLDSQPASQQQVVKGARRELAQGRPVLRVHFYALFASESARKSAQEQYESNSHGPNGNPAIPLLATALPQSSIMRDVGLVATVEADELEFPGVKYAAGVHDNPSFLNGVCLAIEATLGAVPSPVRGLRLRCGTHVFAQIAFADQGTGDVNVAYRIKLDAAQSQLQAQVPKVMRSAAGKKTFAQKLKASSQNVVVQLLLSPAWNAAEEDAGGSGTNVGAIVGVVAGVCALCAVVAVLMVKQRRSDRAAAKAADAEHWQVATTIDAQCDASTSRK